MAVPSSRFHSRPMMISAVLSRPARRAASKPIFDTLASVFLADCASNTLAP